MHGKIRAAKIAVTSSENSVVLKVALQALPPATAFTYHYLRFLHNSVPTKQRFAGNMRRCRHSAHSSSHEGFGAKHAVNGQPHLVLVLCMSR